MANFDDMKLAVEALSGGKNTVLLDDRGMPSIMVAFPKFKISDVIAGGSENIHPAFSVGGAEKDVVYVSKFQNIVMNDRAYSLPFKDPKTGVNFDQSVNYCRNKGTGYIKDSYGCIPERGPLTAMFRLKYWLEQVNRKDEQWYYLKLDISKYFYRISHRILKKILAKKIKDQRLLKLLESIIDCKHTPFGLPPGRSPGEVPLEERLFDVGMPIGNLLSQVFANVYLDALDQFCKRELQIHCYVRYMDDVIILSSSKAQLQEWKVRIASFLETELELQLNNKTCIRPINQGIEFVGYRVWPDKVVLRKKTTLHIKRVLKAKKEAYRVKEISFKQATDTLQSYLGMMKYCDCDALKEKILDDFVLTHADMKQIYEEGGDQDENHYRRGDGWSVEDYPVTDETHRPTGTCVAAVWNY